MLLIEVGYCYMFLVLVNVCNGVLLVVIIRVLVLCCFGSGGGKVRFSISSSVSVVVMF